MIKSTGLTAIVLARKEPFYQWLEKANRAAMVADTDNHFEGDHGTYLVKDIITKKEVDDFVRLHYLALLENELGQWHDRAFWPADLAPALFYEFFEVGVHREVYEVNEE